MVQKFGFFFDLGIRGKNFIQNSSIVVDCTDLDEKSEVLDLPPE